MKPSIVVPKLRETVLTYLTSSFGMAEDQTADSLAGLFDDPDTGMFRGPYLRVSAPFRPAAHGWERALSWSPPDLDPPYRHQALAWQRLSSLNDRTPEPTIVATGTGSGKTESFLAPVLDHCARHAGERGIKAIIIYPMNALATDQSHRIDEFLAEEEALSGVSAGLYIGQESKGNAFTKMTTNRQTMHREPPDILLTNYKMLDMLLSREAAQDLWSDIKLRYLVIDEFHTFNGAQGTDVAMLLRRLRAMSGQEPTPVATSATLGSESEALKVASTIFGTEFPEGAVISEDRLRPEEFIREDPDAPNVDFAGLAEIADPYERASAIHEIAEAVVGSKDLTPVEVGNRLLRNPMTAAVLDGFSSGKLITIDQFFEDVRHEAMAEWRSAWRSGNGRKAAEAALHRLLALISWARSEITTHDGRRRKVPLLKVEGHLWVRSVTRVLRALPRSLDDQENLEVEFAWSTDAEPEKTWLPAISCRHCGRSGWMIAEQHPAKDDKILKWPEIYRVSGVHRQRLIPLISAFPAEYAEDNDAYRPGRPMEENAPLYQLDGAMLLPYDPQSDSPVVLHDSTPGIGDKSRCPACGNDDAIRFVGAGVATLTSVVLSEILQRAIDLSDDPDLRGDERKALVFTDSVQDAAHNAGFLSFRSNSFSLRTYIANILAGTGPATLTELSARAVEELAAEPEALGGVVPAELQEYPGIQRLMKGDDQGSQSDWDMIARRLVFDAMQEFGLRTYFARTLTRSGLVTAEIDLGDGAGEWLANALTASGAAVGELIGDPGREQRLLVHARGVLHRLLMRGGIWHEWLDRWLKGAGRYRWAVWGGRDSGMPAFPKGMSAPSFILDAPNRLARSEFDQLGSGQETWLTNWTRRSLGLEGPDGVRYLRELLQHLARHRVVGEIGTDAGPVYALSAANLHLRLQSKEDAENSQIVCSVCSYKRTVPAADRDGWLDTPCLRWRCTGTYQRGDWNDEYYYDRYRHDTVFNLTASEHTGVLDRQQREDLEREFKGGGSWGAPNVLTATSTLELGIDIGDLSVVGMAGIPADPASYVQRSGRAGRSTGNALVVALTRRRPRDLMLFDDPDSVVNGHIAPPGARLSAFALLQRQYLAYLTDKATRGELEGVKPLPVAAGDLFGEDRWLASLAEVAIARSEEHSEAFLELFGAELDDEARTQFSEWASAGVARTIGDADTARAQDKQRLEQRRTRMAEARADLVRDPDTLPDKQAQLAQLTAESKHVGKRITAMNTEPSHNALVEAGLLPNYSLNDAAWTLEATLSHKSEDDGRTQYRTEDREYQRPATAAIREFAPGNRAYFRGYMHRISGVDTGGSRHEFIEQWVICPNCGTSTPVGTDEQVRTCPGCGHGVGDVGNRYDVLVPRTVFAYDDANITNIDDSSEERERLAYSYTTTVDMRGTEGRSWRSRASTFGFDYSRGATVTYLNLGLDRELADTAHVTIANEDLLQNKFWICPDCDGAYHLDDPTGRGDTGNWRADPWKQHHRFWCRNRDNNKDRRHLGVILGHRLETEAVRFLLPLRQRGDDEKLASFQAALLAGINRYFQGDTSHLRATITYMAQRNTSPEDTEPVAARVYLVLYDEQPSGTGYLKEVSEPEPLLEVLQAARRVAAECDCERDACQRCLLPYTREADINTVGRRHALEVLDGILEGWDLAAGPVVDQNSMNEVVDSEFEVRFNEALEPNAARHGFGVSKTDRRQRKLLHGASGAAWELRTQAPERAVRTRPDYTFAQLAGDQRVVLYLDGYKYHAAPQVNAEQLARIGRSKTTQDAQKRTELREDGAHVFTVTWDDLAAWGSASAADRPDFLLPTDNEAAGWNAAAGAARAMGIDVDLLKQELAQNTLDYLFSYLAEPDQKRQALVARAIAFALASLADDRAKTQVPRGHAEQEMWGLLDGDLPEQGTGGLVAHFTVHDFLTLAVAVDNLGRDPSEWVFTVLARLDDDPERAAADANEYRRAWKAWLRWSHVFQFLDGADHLYWMTGGMDLAHRTRPAPASAEAEPSIDIAFIDPEDMELIVGDDTRSLLDGLAAEGADVPEATVGDEIDGVPFDVSWTDAKIAVLSHSDPRALAEQVASARESGWDARGAGDWTAPELYRRLTASREEGKQ
ncbi:DEAD/DEAH box helicase [Glycomyces tenuis]|uniref:DEAD/DEAH box helicase n=3 Tax=Glycomyces tenuis TaxID=58116 RepID=UPI0003F87E98|nr:DEAD/DEAH box helicase [Glycomyces tenuis]